MIEEEVTIPQYTWRDNTTGTEVEVIRHYREYEEVPSLSESGLTPEQYEAAKWERIIKGKQTVVYVAADWSGKGRW